MRLGWGCVGPLYYLYLELFLSTKHHTPHHTPITYTTPTRHPPDLSRQVRLVLHYEATFTLRGLGLLVDPYLQEEESDEEELDLTAS